MAVIKTSRDQGTITTTSETYFAGRVVKVEKTTETRNWSDTSDYSDYRSTDCTYALVWLGTHNPPPRFYYHSDRPVVESDLLQPKIASYMMDKVRDLEFFEQFAWVDCTNLFSDHNGFRLTCEVDSDGGDPLMWANLIAWDSYRKALVEKQATERRLQEETNRTKENKRAVTRTAQQAKKVVQLEAAKVVAEASLSLIPEKGTKVTVDGITGTLFWKGVSQYRGKWSARGGVKDAAGVAHWIDAQKFCQ